MSSRHRNKIIISSLVILGAILILLGSGNFKTTKDTNEEYAKKLESKLEGFLTEVEGINEAIVIITIDEAYQEASEAFFSSNDTISSPPSVKGVAIACTNGDNYAVKQKVTNLVASYLGITTNKINIVAIK